MPGNINSNVNVKSYGNEFRSVGDIRLGYKIGKLLSNNNHNSGTGYIDSKVNGGNIYPSIEVPKQNLNNKNETITIEKNTNSHILPTDHTELVTEIIEPKTTVATHKTINSNIGNNYVDVNSEFKSKLRTLFRKNFYNIKEIQEPIAVYGLIHGMDNRNMLVDTHMHIFYHFTNLLAQLKKILVIDNEKSSVIKDDLNNCISDMAKVIVFPDSELNIYNKYSNNTINRMHRHFKNNDGIVHDNKTEVYDSYDKEYLDKYYLRLTNEIKAYKYLVEKTIAKLADKILKIDKVDFNSFYKYTKGYSNEFNIVVFAHISTENCDNIIDTMSSIADSIYKNANSEKNLMQLDKYTYRNFCKMSIMAMQRANAIYELAAMYLFDAEGIKW